MTAPSRHTSHLPPRSAASLPVRLQARTIEVDPALVDPYALGARGGFVFAGTERQIAGPAAGGWTLSVPGGLADEPARRALVVALSTIPHDRSAGAPGPPLVALGSLPFDRDAPASLVLPALTFQRTEAGAWLTWVGTEVPPAPATLVNLVQHAAGARSATDRPDGGPLGAAPRLVLHTSDAAYAQGVAAVTSRIAAGKLQKVVLARALDVVFPRPPALGPVLDRLRAAPGCTVFSLPVPGGQILGASPELLVRRSGDRARSLPLAGTQPAGTGRTDGTPEALLGSTKDRAEHHLVVAEVVAALASVSTTVEVADAPFVVHLATMDHLGTPVAAQLASVDGVVPSALDLVARLHPTPAVGGVPRPVALAVINALETTGRGHWSGPAGWLDAEGDGEWIVAIRSATIKGRTARIHAGAGIVEASDPQAEAAETALKLQTALDPVAPGLRLS